MTAPEPCGERKTRDGFMPAATQTKESRDMKTRRSVTTLAVAITAMTGIALAPGTANASTGGGCTTFGPIEACISASGAYVEPDFYVVAPTPGCTELDMTVYDDEGGTTATSFPGYCTGGHHGPYPIVGTNGHHYSVLVSAISASGDDSTLSPLLTFSN
jgi:hypothetical protein